MTDPKTTPQEDTEEFFERLLWDATREYEFELRAVDHPKTRALHRARKTTPRALILSTTRITSRLIAPHPTNARTNWSATTTPPNAPLTLAEKQLQYLARRALEQQNAQEQNTINPVMKTETTVQSAYFSGIMKDIK